MGISILHAGDPPHILKVLFQEFVIIPHGKNHLARIAAGSPSPATVVGAECLREPMLCAEVIDRTRHNHRHQMISDADCIEPKGVLFPDQFARLKGYDEATPQEDSDDDAVDNGRRAALWQTSISCSSATQSRLPPC